VGLIIETITVTTGSVDFTATAFSMIDGVPTTFIVVERS
jgi:hypothetical protein